MKNRRLLMISTDPLILEKGSAVSTRQVEYAKDWDEVDIIVFSQKKGEMVLSPNCFVYSTGSKIKILNPFKALSLARFIAKKRGITNITCQDPFFTSFVGVNIKKQFGIPLEIQIHTDIDSPNYARNFSNKFRKSMAVSYLKQADSVRVVSNRIKEYINSILPQIKNIEVKPIFVDTEYIKNIQISEDLHKKYPQFEKIILMASRLEKEKNIPLAIKAFKELVKSKDRVGLIIVGEGSDKALLVEMAKGLPVIFLPWAKKDILYSYYKTCDIFLNTSRFEGYGMTLVEAKAAGCKVISTDVGVAKEIGAIIVNDTISSLAETLINNLS